MLLWSSKVTVICAALYMVAILAGVASVGAAIWLKVAETKFLFTGGVGLGVGLIAPLPPPPPQAASRPEAEAAAPKGKSGALEKSCRALRRLKSLESMSDRFQKIKGRGI